MPYVLVVDVSHWQKPGLPWITFKGHGVAAGFVQISHGLHAEANAVGHVADILFAGLKLGLYHWLTPFDDARAQAQLFVSLIPRGFRGRLAVDVEQPGTTPAQLDAFLAEFRRLLPGRRIRIYTGAGTWHTLIGHHVTRFAECPLWAAGGPGYDQVETLPPAGYRLTLPDTWTAAELEQFTGHGRVVGFDGDLDISFAVGIDTAEQLAATWEDQPMASPALVPTGSFIGMHSILPGNTIPRARAAYQAGIPYAGFIYLNDGQIGVDLAEASPSSLRLLRYFNSALDSMQGLPTWTNGQMVDYCKAFLDHIEENASDAQVAAAHAILDCNEEDPPELNIGGSESYAKLRDLFIMLIQACEVRNAKRRAQGRPEMHLGLFTFPQGVPEYNEDLALIGDGTLFRLMEQYGHWAIFHEGVFTNQPVELDFPDTIPGSPVIATASPYNFRFVYLYMELIKRGLPIPRTAVTEFYDGGGYPGDPDEHARRFAWYETHIALLPSAIVLRFGFFAGFTCNPNGGWIGASYDDFYGSEALRALRSGVRDRRNLGLGGNPMPVTFTDPDFATLAGLIDKYRLHPMNNLTNQVVINLFNTVFGSLAMLEAQLTTQQRATLYAKNAVNGQRDAFYNGPAVEAMPALTPDQKALVIASLPH